MKNITGSIKNLPSLLLAITSIGVLSAEYFLIFTPYYTNWFKFALSLSLVFDLIFLAEFIFRLIRSLIKGTLLEYFFLRSGWIDLLVPAGVLALFSLPLLAGEVGLNFPVLPVKDQIFSIGLIRLIRFLKLTGNNAGTENQTMKRNLASVMTTAVIACITVIFSLTLLSDWNLIPSARKQLETAQNSKMNQMIKFYGLLSPEEFPRVLKASSSTWPDIALIEFDKKIMVSKSIANDLIAQSGVQESVYRMKNAIGGRLRVIFSMEAIYQTQSASALFYIAMLCAIIIFIQVFYRRHLSISLIIPIKKMLRGFEETYAVDPVPVNTFYHDDEIARLITSFNNRWMKAKLRKLKEIENRR
jgi:hypothetical protein